jgi:GNAT superfamily N-acetyltransferase
MTSDFLLNGSSGVRLAVPGDEEEIFGLLTLFHEEHALFTMSPEKVRTSVHAATHRVPDHTGALGMIGVVEQDGRLVGTIGLFVGQDWYSSDNVINERWNFVHKDYRRSDYAKRLVNFSKACQQWFESAIGMMPLVIGVFSTVRTEAKVRLYRRWLPQAGAIFIYGKTPRQPDDGSSTIIPSPQTRSPVSGRARH